MDGRFATFAVGHRSAAKAFAAILCGTGGTVAADWLGGQLLRFGATLRHRGVAEGAGVAAVATTGGGHRGQFAAGLSG